MRREKFKSWLQAQKKHQPNVIADQLSRAGKVDKIYGDLDSHYDDDYLVGIIRKLSYTMDDERKSLISPSKISIKGNTRKGLASYKAAVNLYKKFRDEEDTFESTTQEVHSPSGSQLVPPATGGIGLERDMQADLSEDDLVIKDLWFKFNEYSNNLTVALGRTSNIVGEYAEYLAHRHYGGGQLEISHPSADIKIPDGTLYQVKSRKIKKSPSTQLSVIRSWDFDFLVVVLFDANGAIKKAIQVPVEVAKEYSKPNKHQNGWVITTNQKFLNDQRSTDITVSLSMLNK